MSGVPRKDTGKQYRPRSDAAERGVWSRSTLFALNTEIPIRTVMNKNWPDNPTTENGRALRIEVEESNGHKWVNYYTSALELTICKTEVL